MSTTEFTQRPSERFPVPCAVISNWDCTASQVIAYCKAIGAVVRTGELEQYVIQLPDKTEELWPAAMLRCMKFKVQEVWLPPFVKRTDQRQK